MRDMLRGLEPIKDGMHKKTKSDTNFNKEHTRKLSLFDDVPSKHKPKPSKINI